jgi:hypothetical protein
MNAFVFVRRRGGVLVIKSVLRGTDNDINYETGYEVYSIKYCELILISDLLSVVIVRTVTNADSRQ